MAAPFHMLSASARCLTRHADRHPALRGTLSTSRTSESPKQRCRPAFHLEPKYVKLSSMREDRLWLIFQKTGGHCHYCGDRLRFSNRGWSAIPNGHWEVDHVVQRKKGGYASDDNCLPACTECNRLRWARTGPALRRLVRLGLIASEEIERGSDVGLELSAMLRTRIRQNEARRLEKYLDGRRWELYRGRHFRGRAATLERRLRDLATRRGGSISVQNDANQRLIVRYIAR
jgi:5-methylcytosine-specific restriction endonuclease McrA